MELSAKVSINIVCSCGKPLASDFNPRYQELTVHPCRVCMKQKEIDGFQGAVNIVETFSKDIALNLRESRVKA